MKKNYRNIIILICAIVAISSCKKYLEIQPEDKLLEEQVFTSAKNIKAYLNGTYVKLGGNTLYGENLTLTIPDLLAQRYNMIPANGTGVNIYNQYAVYAYASGAVSTKMAEIWTNAYSAIFNVNRFMANLTKYPGVLDARTDSTYRGEALAIRAMLHFDMLRLFGPMYNSADSASSAIQMIPYATSGEITVAPFFPANRIMDHIMADLSKAESLLSNDKTMNQDKKYKFTYYSVKALQARANLYRGNKAEALACALVLINSNKFPWVDKINILNEKGSPDKIFSSEMILGAYNPDLYKEGNGQLKIFSAGLADNSILAPKDERLTALFSPELTADYRFSFQFWDAPASKTYKTFLKYADVEDKTKPFRNTIPLLKLSEMYYIAAECEPNMTIASSYLTAVRSNRGINTVAFPVTATPTEILKEYQKEFFGEGQLFYYYKRNKVATIPNGNKVSDTDSPFSMTAAEYVVPIPTTEISNR